MGGYLRQIATGADLITSNLMFRRVLVICYPAVVRRSVQIVVISDRLPSLRQSFMQGCVDAKHTPQIADRAVGDALSVRRYG
jgi:hypothetical protein